MLTLVWGPGLAPVMSALIIERPVLARRLVLAPRRFVHAIAAYVHHALDIQDKLDEIALQIEEQDVRALLSRAVSNPHPRFYKTLDRVGPAVLDLDFYRRLNTALHGPAVDTLLTAEEVTAVHIDVVMDIVADPVLLAAQKAIGWSGTNLKNLQHALVYLRAKGLAADIEQLPSGCGWKAIHRRISSDLGRARAPEAAFEVPMGWRQVNDVADLWQAGAILGNCVSSLVNGGEGYVGQLITGEAVFLVHDADPSMLACIRCVGPNLYTLAETTTSSPGSKTMLTREALSKALTITIGKTGGALLEHSPLSAIRSIGWRVERGKDDEVDDLEDVFQ